MGEGDFGSWDVSLRRVLRPFEEAEFGSLKNLLSNVFFCRDVVDSRIWMPCSSGAFSCKSFYKELEGFPSINASASLAWLGLAPPRVEAFMWLALSGKVSTADNLRRRGLTSMAISDICVLCGKVNETVDHLFVHCEFSYSLWCRFLARCGVLWSLPRSLVGLVEAWRLSSFFGSSLIL